MTNYGNAACFECPTCLGNVPRKIVSSMKCISYWVVILCTDAPGSASSSRHAKLLLQERLLAEDIQHLGQKVIETALIARKRKRMVAAEVTELNALQKRRAALQCELLASAA